MKRKRPFLVIPVLLVIGIGIAVYFLTRGGRPRYIGTLDVTKVDIPARLATTIDAVNVNEGDPVKRDQVVVRLNGDEIKISLDDAQRDYERAERLFKVGSMPREAYDHARFKFQDASLKWAWVDVKSPLNGRVLTRYKEPGEWASPGMRLLTVADLSEVWAYFYVDEPMLSRLKLGQTVVGRLPEMPGRAFQGKITKLSDEAEFTPKNVQTITERERLVYGVKVTFPNPDETLKPGSSIEATLP